MSPSSSIDASTALYAFFAHPCRHSKSPLMHNAAFQALGLNCRYLAFDVDESRLRGAVEAMRTLNIRGANLSMPNKTAVIPYLDELAPEAELAGAVNTIVSENGRLVGHNTDGVGWLRGIREAGIPLNGEKLTLVGTGGAAKAILATAALRGAGEISVFNRRSRHWQQAEDFVAKLRFHTACNVHLYELNNHDPDCLDALRREISQSVLLANATNVGMGALEGQTWLPDPSFLRPSLAVSDVIYVPAETKLLQIAKSVGCTTQNGAPMVLYQGAIAFHYWTGQEMPLDVVRHLLGM
jgi:shikimate dehydrogenase